MFGTNMFKNGCFNDCTCYYITRHRKVFCEAVVYNQASKQVHRQTDYVCHSRTFLILVSLFLSDTLLLSVFVIIMQHLSEFDRLQD